jgi:hypothetical protein
MEKEIKRVAARLAVVSMLFVSCISPIAYGGVAATCDFNIDVLPGQAISLHATPDTPVGSYDYLWTASTGVTLPGTVNTFDLAINAPDNPGDYEVSVLVTNNKDAPGLTCVDLKTVCIHVIAPECPLCDGNFCKTSPTTYPTTTCPPVFVYAGHKGTGYIYHYSTISHANYAGVSLQETSVSDYTLDWSRLDQPTATNTKVCTVVKFWITDKAGTTVGTSCEKTICLYWGPVAAITSNY